MGRLKIKKKDTVLPFRQTFVYRMLLLALSILFFVFTLYEMTMAWSVNNTLAFIIAAMTAICASFLIFYNLDRLKLAKVPESTLKRIKRSGR